MDTSSVMWTTGIFFKIFLILFDLLNKGIAKRDYMTFTESSCTESGFISLHIAHSSPECLDLCDSLDSCVAAVYHFDNSCWLKDSCSFPLVSNVQNQDVYIRQDLPGWTQAKMDCGYNDIEYLSSVTPNMCREKCNLNSECVAVLYLFNNLACYLKRMCNQKTNSGTSHLYMPIEPDLNYSRFPSSTFVSSTLKRQVTLSTVAQCENACDLDFDCEGYTFTEPNVCDLRVGIDTDFNHALGASSGIKTNFPGWTTHWYDDCYGNDIYDIVYISPSACITLCMKRYECTAVLFRLNSRRCYLKYFCEDRKYKSPGDVIFRNHYRNTDRFSLHPGKLPGGESLVSSSQTSQIKVYFAWQCGNMCTRFGCGCFYITSVGSDMYCSLLQSCTTETDDASATKYTYAGYSTDDYNVTADIGCHGAPITDAHGSVMSVEDCAGLCNIYPGCANAEYETATKTCQVKGQCVRHTQAVGKTLLAKLNTDTMVTPYTALMDKDCKGPSSVVIVREETVDLDDCIDLCDSRSDCAVVVFTDDRYYSANVYGPLYVYEEGYTRGCWLKYGCNGEILDLNGVSSHVKNEIPGWSMKNNTDCVGNVVQQIDGVSTPYECSAHCLVTTNCMALLYHYETRMCQLKSTCSKITELPGFMTYRFIDMGVTSFKGHPGKDIEGNNLYYFDVVYDWHCLAACQRSSLCKCFVMFGPTCYLKNTCDGIVDDYSDVILHLPTNVSTDGYHLAENTWCGGLNSASEYLDVPSAELCVSVCGYTSGCVAAVYDTVRSICYVKSECTSITESVEHNTYFTIGEWSDWTESACGEIVSGEITQHRTCEGGAYCEGESIKCARRCDGARTYGTILQSLRLSGHTIKRLSLPSFGVCLSLCLGTCDCSSINYSVRQTAFQHSCELNRYQTGQQGDNLLRDWNYNFLELSVYV